VTNHGQFSCRPIARLLTRAVLRLRTLCTQYHHGKHHRAYVDNLNKQIAGKEWDSKDLDAIVMASWNNGTPTPEFNNAAQVWKRFPIGSGVNSHTKLKECSRNELS